jgi:enamine deaminase RidA (YjgF/YER057c/UK114 family)
MERRILKDGSAFEETAAYSRGVRAGDLVAISGTAALEDGIALYPGDMYRQTQAAIEKALAAAAALGAEPRDVIRTRLLLAPGSDWRAAIRAHEEAFRGIDPANTTWFVGGFVPPGVLVEIELDAVVAA